MVRLPWELLKEYTELATRSSQEAVTHLLRQRRIRGQMPALRLADTLCLAVAVDTSHVLEGGMGAGNCRYSGRRHAARHCKWQP